MICEASTPVGALATTYILTFLPSHFPHQATEDRSQFRQNFTRKTVQRLDLIGAFLNLAASIPPIFALKEGGSEFPCNGAIIIASFVLSGIMWITFVGWEGFVGRLTKNVQEVLFLLRLVKDRIFVGLLS